ncbi:MAG TPA: hypothetical protein VF761_05580, partial [Gemmatimonadaceae bacterium]
MRRSSSTTLLRASIVSVLALAGTSCDSGPDARLSVGYFARGSYADRSYFHAEVTQGNITRSFGAETMKGATTLPADRVQLEASGIALSSRQPVTVELLVGPIESVVTESVT